MGTSHKHAEIIKAWANGAKIQHFDNGKWYDIPSPLWDQGTVYRIKPEPKPDVISCAKVSRHGNSSSFMWCFGVDENYNLKLTFDGETGALKAAEVLK